MGKVERQFVPFKDLVGSFKIDFKITVEIINRSKDFIPQHQKHSNTVKSEVAYHKKYIYIYISNQQYGTNDIQGIANVTL